LAYDKSDPVNAAWGCYEGTTCIALGADGTPTSAKWADSGQPPIDIGARIDFVDLDAEECWSRIASKLLSEGSTEGSAVRKFRIGQDWFRDALDKRWEFRCALTDLGMRELLRASHIVPWAQDKTARLDEANGLLLAAHVDALFGEYLISFDQDGELVWSRHVPEETKRKLGFPLRLRGALTAREQARLASHLAEMRGRGG
jgi:hypothetical protein